MKLRRGKSASLHIPRILSYLHRSEVGKIAEEIVAKGGSFVSFSNCMQCWPIFTIHLAGLLPDDIMIRIISAQLDMFKDKVNQIPFGLDSASVMNIIA